MIEMRKNKIYDVFDYFLPSTLSFEGNEIEMHANIF